MIAPGIRISHTILALSEHVLYGTPVFGQWIQESHDLQSGWNSVYLDLEKGDTNHVHS